MKNNQETQTIAADGSIANAAWLGGRTVQEARDFVKSNKLKLRKGSVGIFNNKTMVFSQRPIIECWAKERRKYLPFEYAETPWFESREERDAVLEAIST